MAHGTVVIAPTHAQADDPACVMVHLSTRRNRKPLAEQPGSVSYA